MYRNRRTDRRPIVLDWDDDNAPDSLASKRVLKLREERRRKEAEKANYHILSIDIIYKGQDYVLNKMPKLTGKEEVNNFISVMDDILNGHKVDGELMMLGTAIASGDRVSYNIHYKKLLGMKNDPKFSKYIYPGLFE